MPGKPRTYRSPGQGPVAAARIAADRDRGSARARGYSSDWDERSATFRALNPLCLGCHAVGRVAATTVTDHTLPHKGDPVRFWDRGNWQPGCDWHHDTVKQILEKRFAAGAIGPAALRFDSPEAIALTRELMGLESE